MGKSPRFMDLEFIKKKNNPGPANYSIIAAWHGKTTPVEKNAKNIYDVLSGSVNKSVYYN